MSKIYDTKLQDILNVQGQLFNDRTEVVLVKGCTIFKGKWYEDKILNHSQEWVEGVAIDFPANQMRVILKTEVQG